MKYIRKFTEHSVYEANKNELLYPSVCYCVKENEVHYGSNLGNIRFYVGDLSGNTNQTVVINYSNRTSDRVSIQEGNKWYSHNIPSGKTLSSVTNLDYIKEAVVNCDKAYAQNWSNVDKVSYFNCDILGDIFGQCSFNNSNFTSLDLRTVGTSNVTDMSIMFSGCSGLTSLDVSNFDTSNVTSMNQMFYNCSGLTSLDLSGWNTSKVTDMNAMFQNCRGLTSLGLSGWKNSKVTDMGNMFEGCRSLTSLDLSNFNTSNVTRMYGMFQNCSGLTSLDLSNFNTSNVTDMRIMFDGCSHLTSLDLSGWDMTNVTSTSNMFGDCYKLTTITMKGCNTDTINKIKAVKPSTATIITE